MHKKGNNGVKDQYYSKEEYRKLSTNAKEKLRKICEWCPQGGRPRGGGDIGIEPHKKIRKVKKKSKKFQRIIKKLEAKRVDDENKSNSSDSDDSSVDDAARTNHNHPALTRQSTVKGESKRG